MTILTFLFFTALVGVLTWMLTRKDDHGTSTGYFLAGRTLTGGFIAGSLLLTNLSTEQLVGLNGSAFTDGICVMAWEVIAGASLVIMALYFLPKYLRSGIATIPEFLEKRFNGTTRSITTFIFILAYALILLPIILYSGATGLMGILDLKTLTGIQDESTLLWVTVWFIGIVGSIYAIFGGLRTVAVSDTINGFGLLLGSVMITVFALWKIGDGGLVESLATIRETHPEKFNSLGSKGSSVPFSTLFTGVLLLNLFYWTTNQQIIQRTFGATSLAEGQKGVLIAGMFKVLAPIVLVLPGVIAFSMFGVITIDGTDRAIKDAVLDRIALVGVSDGKEVILHGEAAEAVLGIVDLEKAKDVEGTVIPGDGGAMLEVKKILGPGTAIIVEEDGSNRYVEVDLQKKAFPRRADKAYGLLVSEVLPPWLTGFFAAVMVGAILSSFNSALNSTATLFSLGIYKHHFQSKAADEKNVIKNGKIVGTVIAIFAMSTAPLLAGEESIFGYLQKMNGLYFIPIFSVVLAGFLFRRAGALAANVSLVAGCGILLIGSFVQPFSVWTAKPFTNFHFLGIVFGSLLLFQFLMSKIRPLPQDWEQKDSGDVDLTPWKWAKPIGFGIVLVVVAIYLALADFSVLKG